MKMKILSPILLLSSLLAVPLIASAATHIAGTNVINNGTIYMVTPDSQLRPYTSAGAFLSYGFNSWSNVVQANSDDLALPVGAFIPPRDGSIICSNNGSDKGTCYLITNGQKAAFTSENVFNNSGFSFKYALYGDVSFLPATGSISDASQGHLPGTLIDDNGTVKIVGTNGTIGVPSMDVLQSWGYSLVDVVKADTADQGLSQNAVLATHTAGQLAYTGTASTPATNPTSTTAPVAVPSISAPVVTPKPVVTPQPTPTVPTQPASTPTQPQVTAPSVSISGSSGSQNVSDGSPKQTLGTFTISLSSEPITVQTMAFTITPSNENDGISGYPSLVIVNPNGNTISTSNSTSNTFSSNDTLTFTNVALSMSGTYKIVGAGSGGIGDTFVLSTNPATNWSGAIGKTSGLTASLPNTVINLGTATFVGGGFILIAQIPTNYSQTVAASNDIAFTNLQLVPGWNGNLGSDGYIQLASVPLDLTANNGGTASNLSSCQLLNGTTPLNTGSNIVNPSSGQNIFTLDQPLRTTGTVTLTLTCDVGTNTTNGSSFAWSINPNDSWAPTNNKYAVSLQVEPSFTSSQPTTITSGGLNNSVVIVTNGYNNNLFVNASPVKIAAIQFNQATQTPVQLRGMQYQVISSDGVVPTLQLEYPDTNVQGTSVNSVIAGTRGNNIIGTNFSGSQTQMYLYASAPTAGSFVIQITGIQLADPSSGTNIPITGIPLTTGTITVQ